jgi:hypothetical protein
MGDDELEVTESVSQLEHLQEYLKLSDENSSQKNAMKLNEL